jgi:hypothetical protein
MLDDAKVKEIVQDEQLFARVKDMLGLFEHLAVGSNAGVFDIDMLNKMSGPYLINIFNRFKPYIEQRRFESNTTTLYIQYEQFVNDLATLPRG